jgi:hypothetical protein
MDYSKYHKRPYTVGVDFDILEPGDIIYNDRHKYYIKILEGNYNNNPNMLNCSAGLGYDIIENIVNRKTRTGWVGRYSLDDMKMVTIKVGYQTPLWKVLNGEEI